MREAAFYVRVAPLCCKVQLVGPGQRPSTAGGGMHRRRGATASILQRAKGSGPHHRGNRLVQHRCGDDLIDSLTPLPSCLRMVSEDDSFGARLCHSRCRALPRRTSAASWPTVL